MDKIKGTRDTVAHGFYVGTMHNGTAMFSNYTSTYSSGDDKGAELELVHPDRIEAEVNILADQLTILQGVFETAKLKELLQMPAYGFAPDPKNTRPEATG